MLFVHWEINPNALYNINQSVMVIKMNYTLPLLALSLMTMNSVYADSNNRINPENNHAYQRFDTALNWHDAQTACTAKAAHLASITSANENSWIQTNLYSIAVPAAWIGGSDETTEGFWEWTTHEAWGYSNWNTGEPNNTAGNENVTEMWMAAGGVWNDLNADTTHSYICEWDTIPLRLNGNITRLTPHEVICTNDTTKQSVTFTTSHTFFDCVAHGLTISAGDKATVSITGKIR
ncbi:MAG: hypothetical protein RI964_2131 [Pseudomonadota bacterium]